MLGKKGLHLNRNGLKTICKEFDRRYSRSMKIRETILLFDSK